MNFLIFLFGFIYLTSLNLVSLGEQLFHREGRFVDLAINKYKTQLPSIYDVANVMFNYRMPLAVFVPSVRLNVRPKQKRTHFSNFPSQPKKAQQTNNQTAQEVQNSKLQPVTNDQQETLSKLNKQDLTPSSNLISRSGWTARSLSKPKSYYSNKLRSLNERRSNLANLPLSESNVDLIPFLYKENLPNPSSLFNSHYQLTNSNPNHVFSQNIAYYQPNSLAPFQPNILLLTPNHLPTSIDSQPKINNQSLASNLKNNSSSISNATLQSIAIPDQLTVSQSVSSNLTNQLISSKHSESIVNNSSETQFDISQVSSNPEEIEQEHVQSHEPIDANVPVNPILNDESISNSTAIISNASSIALSERSVERPQLDNQAAITNLDPVLIYPPYTSNLIKQLTSNNQIIHLNQIKPKNLITNRSLRSLSVDMPSIANLYTAAAAQSGQSSENRRQLFARFLNDNLN